jgi:Zn-dependent protease
VQRRFSDRRLGFVQRGDPSSGFFLIMLLVLASSLFSGRSLPPTRQIVAVLVSFIIATTIHEFMHAYTAWRLGDDTAKSLGRITLNPVAHFEPFGFFGMVMIALGRSFIGWGKPVPVNPNRFRGTGIIDRKRAMALVAFAGPVSNVVQAAAVALPLRYAREGGSIDPDLVYYMGWFFTVNILLASFNMIPIPPLDGHKILSGILPNFWYPVLAPLERYGFMILFLLFFATSWFNLPSLTDDMIRPVQDLLFRALL